MRKLEKKNFEEIKTGKKEKSKRNHLLKSNSLTRTHNGLQLLNAISKKRFKRLKGKRKVQSTQILDDTQSFVEYQLQIYFTTMAEGGMDVEKSN